MLLHRGRRRHENARLLSCFAAHLLDELPSLLRADRRLRGDATVARARLTTGHRDVYADDRGARIGRPVLSNAERVLHRPVRFELRRFWREPRKLWACGFVPGIHGEAMTAGPGTLAKAARVVAGDARMAPR
jgi:hypothetical protein